MTELILIVEDEDQIRMQLKWILADAGYDVVFAKTAKEGLAELGKKNIDLVLMDINLGSDMDGKVATEIIKINPRTANMPVIAVTGYSAKEEIESIYDSGVDEVITKPIDSDLLIDRVRARLDCAAN